MFKHQSIAIYTSIAEEVFDLKPEIGNCMVDGFGRITYHFRRRTCLCCRASDVAEHGHDVTGTLGGAQRHFERFRLSLR